MRWLISTALRLRVAVIVLAAALAIFGLSETRNAPLDVFPEFAPPLVEIQTEAPGLSTTEVESLVSAPIENAVNGVMGLKTLRSKSVLGLSSVVLILDSGADLLRTRQLVQERLATVTGQLPAVARPPVMLSPLSSTSRAMKIGLSSQTLSQVELSTLARWTIRPRLMAVRGVANVAIWGQRDRQFHVLVDPERLRDHTITLDEVTRATRDAALQTAGGYVDTPNQRLAVAQPAVISGVQELGLVPVAFRKGSPVLVRDVAKVVEGFPQPIGDAVIDDGPGILLIVEKQPTGNTLDVTRGVEAALDALRPGLQGVKVDSTIFRPATFIEMSLANLNRALLFGALLVVAILIAFLFEWRTALISLTALPLSLITAALIIRYSGQTINTMVLAGLAIALGEVVDDAIIDVENIVRRLRLNRAAANPEPAFRVVLNASLEVRSAVVHASLIVGLVFLPVFFLDGLAGSFFRPLALSYVLAVLASLVVALTVTPAMALLLLPGSALAHRESPLTRGLRRVYRAWVGRALDRPRLIGAATALILVATAVAVPFLGEDFLPSFREYDFLMHFVEKPGTSLDAMRRITINASRELRAIEGVRNFGSHIGRAEVADEVVGPNFTELWISVDPKVPYESTVAKIQAAVDGYPGLTRDLLTYLKERIKEVLSGGSGAIVVRIFGPGVEGLQSQAAVVAAAIKDIPGVTNLQIEQQTLVPQVELRVLQDAASRFGLNTGDVRRAVNTYLRGTKVGEVYEDQKIFDIMVWTDPDARSDIEALRRLRLDTPSGANIPLGDVIDIRVVPAPNVIQHENTSRRIDVSCNVAGRDLGSVAREIESAVRALPFPQGYHPEFLGEYAARQAARRRLMILGAAALIGILLILYSDFQSFRLAGIVFLSLPFALVGAALMAFLAGGVLSLGSLVGFVTVIGIAARNGIMLVSHYRHLESEEGEAPGRALIVRGSEERLAPILMTGLATALALLPIAAGGNRPGHEIEHPMAIVILGGLLTSTLLNLFVMPVLYQWVGRRKDSPDQTFS
ncbi:MAG TPA: efflux RND transporter permease subunit [Terriglobia bacterium]|nr:efflux RND transporter permease subunit [Terriglobia bacterium]